MMRLRPTRMNRLMLLLPALALGIAGCGSAGETNQPGESSTAEAKQTVGSCSPDDAAVTGAASLGRADLDGAGSRQDVRLTADGGSCGNTLFVKSGDGILSLSLDDVTLSTEDSSVIRIPGRKGDIVVARQAHPRGGFQLHLYAVADGRLGEVLADGEPVIRFVATDSSQGTPLTAECVDGGFTITAAVAHEPIGVLFAWDLWRSEVTLEGNTATVTGPTEIKDNVLPQQLEQDYATLAKNEFFADCTVS